MYGGQVLISVGSTVVKELVMTHQPLLGLHGHIHEGKGAFNLGRTLCINPGSSYEQGVLLGAVIDIERDKVKRYVMTTG